MEERLFVYLVTSVLIGIVSCQDLVISPKQDVIVKKLTEGVSLKCEVEGLPDGQEANIQWFDAAGVQVTSRVGRIKIMSFSAKELRLAIRNLADGDEGFYSCKAVVNGNNVEKRVEIQLYKGITITGSPHSQRPNIYSEAFIECNADATPVPTIHWAFGNETAIQSGGRYVQEKQGLKIKNITEQDNGLYYCIINVDDMGDFRQYNISVQVTKPPKSSRPATFIPAIVGKRFEMNCYATGDPAPTFTFYKDKNPAPLDGPKFKVDKNNGRLEVDQMEETDSGDYSCVASNERDGVRDSTTGGRIEETVNVVVFVPPRIVSVSDISKPEKQKGTLVCVAEGNPAPEMTWRKFGTDEPYSQDASGAGQRGILESTTDELPSGSKRSTLSLIFNQLQPIDTDVYVCTATNKAGTASENGTIRVEFKPNFQDTPYSETYGWSNHVSPVECVANAEPEAFVEWYRNGEMLPQNSTYGIQNKKSTGKVSSILSVSVLPQNEAWIYGTYTCKAKNAHGNTTHDIILTPARTPGTAIVQPDDTTPTSIVILITPPADEGGQPVTEYKVEYNLQGSTDVQTIIAPRPPSNSGEKRSKTRITDLKPDKIYKITVRARNNVGLGAPKSLSERTPKVRKPAPVLFESPGQGTEPDFYILSWFKPLTGGKPITGYKINYRRVEIKGNSPATWEVDRYLEEPIPLDVEEDVTSYRLERLVPDTYYEVEVIAINVLGGSEGRKMIFKTSKGTAEVRDNNNAHAPFASISSICMAIFVYLACMIW